MREPGRDKMPARLYYKMDLPDFYSAYQNIIRRAFKTLQLLASADVKSMSNGQVHAVALKVHVCSLFMYLLQPLWC
jgi:hypothetical protein